MPKVSQVAKSVPFDNSTNPLISQEVQGAIEELITKLTNAASPGYVFTKSGTINNSWLLVGSVPSDKTGINFGFYNGSLTSITVANEQVGSFDVQLYEHDGSTYTLLTSISLSSERSKEFTSADFGSVAITKGLELAVRIVNGQAKNPIISIQASGSNTP